MRDEVVHVGGLTVAALVLHGQTVHNTSTIGARRVPVGVHRAVQRLAADPHAAAI